MSFPQFPDGHVNHEITFDEKGHDMFIGWQLEHVSRDKRKLYTAYYKKCLGAVQCTSCNVWLRLKSSKGRIDAQITENCPSCLKPTLIHVECHVKVHFHIKSKTGVMNHEGTHTHGKFIPLHFTMETLEKVEERVLEFPAEKPNGLKIGTSPMRIQKPARPVSDIDPNLRNLGMIKRFQRTYLAKNDKLRSSPPAHMELADLTNEFPGYLQSADITPRKMCITFCAPDIAMKADFKKHPILTDVTYDCFTKGYYLCTTNIYFEEIDKFGTFNFVFGHTDEVIDMDFSGLKQSVQQIVSNHAVVPPGYDVDFIDLTEIMYNSMGSNAYDRAAHPTRTTNGIEPFHRDLYRIVESKKPVIDTMYQIFVYLNSIELDFDHVKNVYDIPLHPVGISCSRQPVRSVNEDNNEKFKKFVYKNSEKNIISKITSSVDILNRTLLNMMPDQLEECNQATQSLNNILLNVIDPRNAVGKQK
ncbi:hypothetical protein INT45_011691 [Circinella minor]|uniref:Uncharacterized protein n=1 Tax=Circinella minor TaxID=1195481 RepID=A0A8H7VT30_9FUNG|nr:hypothetical protein INT45_011691 [Circinella minor]